MVFCENIPEFPVYAVYGILPPIFMPPCHLKIPPYFRLVSLLRKEDRQQQGTGRIPQYLGVDSSYRNVYTRERVY